MNCDLCILLSYMLRILCEYNSTQPGQIGAKSKQLKSFSWSYSGETGPEHWGKHYPKCSGIRQSPINILTYKVLPVTWLSKFEFLNYDQISGEGQSTFLRLRNNGHTASMAIDNEIFLRGSNLGEVFRAAEIHFHWGPDDKMGSEHGIDNFHHPLEVHFVHYNTKYKDLKEAMVQPDGLAVIGVFADISDQVNVAFEHIAVALEKITEYDQKTVVEGIRPLDLLPNDTSKYYHYEGSLTTPPCYESVSWYVMHDGIHVTRDQIERLRHLKEHIDEGHSKHDAPNELKLQTKMDSSALQINNHKPFTNSKYDIGKRLNSSHSYILHNFRPCQALHDRIVFCSHPSLKTLKSAKNFKDIVFTSHVSNMGGLDLSKAVLEESGFHNIYRQSHPDAMTITGLSHLNMTPSKKIPKAPAKKVEQTIPKKDSEAFKTKTLQGYIYNEIQKYVAEKKSTNERQLVRQGPYNQVSYENAHKDYSIYQNSKFNSEYDLNASDLYKIFANIFLQQAKTHTGESPMKRVELDKLMNNIDFKQLSTSVFNKKRLSDPKPRFSDGTFSFFNTPATAITTTAKSQGATVEVTTVTSKATTPSLNTNPRLAPLRGNGSSLRRLSSLGRGHYKPINSYIFSVAKNIPLNPNNPNRRKSYKQRKTHRTVSGNNAYKINHKPRQLASRKNNALETKPNPIQQTGRKINDNKTKQTGHKNNAYKTKQKPAQHASSNNNTFETKPNIMQQKGRKNNTSEAKPNTLPQKGRKNKTSEAKPNTMQQKGRKNKTSKTKHNSTQLTGGDQLHFSHHKGKSSPTRYLSDVTTIRIRDQTEQSQHLPVDEVTRQTLSSGKTDGKNAVDRKWLAVSTIPSTEKDKKVYQYSETSRRGNDADKEVLSVVTMMPSRDHVEYRNPTLERPSNFHRQTDSLRVGLSGLSNIMTGSSVWETKEKRHKKYTKRLLGLRDIASSSSSPRALVKSFNQINKENHLPQDPKDRPFNAAVI